MNLRHVRPLCLDFLLFFPLQISVSEKYADLMPRGLPDIDVHPTVIFCFVFKNIFKPDSGFISDLN